MALITFEQQKLIKPITGNNQAKYNQLVNEVELVELVDLIGIDLYYAISETPQSNENKALIEGCEYVNRHGNTIQQKGLRYILAYFIFSRYIAESFIQDTYSGMVQQSQANAEPISSGSITRLQEANRKIGLKAWEQVYEYLILFKDLYPAWKPYQQNKVYTPILRGIKKTESEIKDNTFDWLTRQILK